MFGNFGFLLFDEFEDLDFMGPWEMVALWSQKFGGPEELVIINETGKHVTSAKGLTLHATANLEACPDLDYLLVPGGQGTRTEVNNQHLINFIKKQSHYCKAILSVCTGSFLLQAAGLLTGKKATTHWASLARLNAFPELEVVKQRYVKDGDIWTSAGISAGIDMALAFIAETAGHHVAAEIQHFAEYYPDGKIYHKS